jgi:hypothetical protein
MGTKKEILHEMLQKQRKNVLKKLSYNDITRIVKNINKSIFGTECCLWEGYITNINNNVKSQYINFYFKDKKIALHRLLYLNYIGDISNNEYIKFKCENKGVCCNINHLSKFEKDDCIDSTDIDDILKEYIIDNPDYIEKEEKKEKKLEFKVIFD